MEGYSDLANAIVLCAVKDWRKSVSVLKKRPRYEPARWMKKECEAFFLSEWFIALTSVDGSVILEKLMKEAESND